MVGFYDFQLVALSVYHAKRSGRNKYRFFVPEMCTAAPPAAH
jgi:hypothetical protein